MYLTYEEYQNMGGTLDETAFNNLEYEARTYIDYVTFNRLKADTDVSEDVKRCMYYIMNLLQNKMTALNGGDTASEDGVGGIISGQSNDGVSVSYNVMSAKDILTSNEDEINKAIHRYLQTVTNSLGRRVLYRGLYPDE